MLQLPVSELVVFLVVFGIYLAAAVVGILQLQSRREVYKRILVPLIGLAVSLEIVILIFRAVTIQSFPLTGLFESMIVLTVVFGLLFLCFSIPIRQVWFGSAMSWVLLALTILSAMAAQPPSEPNPIAATPWAISHGIAMILSGVSILFATAGGILYLLSEWRLKQKKISNLLGKMPNIEKLDHLNEFGLQAGFVLMTIGLASGMGMAATKSLELNMPFSDWLIDPKIVLILCIWVILALVLVLRYAGVLSTRQRMYVTIVTVSLILFALVGTSVFCKSKHEFRRESTPTVQDTR